MKTYVFTKKIEGQDMYLQPDGSFSHEPETAREFKASWIIIVLKILLQILIALFGEGKLKAK